MKDLLQLTLPKFKRMVNTDLEEKKLFLSENPQYRQLYMDLVKSNVISSKKFWSDHETQFIKQQQDTKNAALQYLRFILGMHLNKLILCLFDPTDYF